MSTFSEPRIKEIHLREVTENKVITLNIYRPQRSCGQGNVFTGVCLSTGGGGCLPQCMLGCHSCPPRMENPPPGTGQTPPGWRTPPGPGRHPPRMENPPGKQTPANGLRAAGTHPTGMHCCFKKLPLLIQIIHKKILVICLHFY